MNNFELVVDDEVIEIPEEITLGMYQEINKAPDRYKNNLQAISLFTGLTVRELKNLDVETVKLIEAYIGNRFTLPDKNELVLTFEHNGVLYGLENDWSKLAFGAWVDFEVYSSDNIYSNLDKIMAILYRPVISQDKKDKLKYKIVPYKSEEIEERAEVMRLTPARYWMGASLFFSQVVNIYIDNIRDSLSSMNRMRMLTMEGWKRLPKFLRKRLSLDSILPSFTDSQIKILQNLTKLKI